MTEEDYEFVMASITRQEFEEHFPHMVEDLVSEADVYGMPSGALDWYRRVSKKTSPL